METITTIATALIAIAAILTWRVYMDLRRLAKKNNEILQVTNETSREMVQEARRSREAEFAPYLVPQYSDPENPGRLAKPGVDGGQRRACWLITNKGRGSALEVTIAEKTMGGEPIPPKPCLDPNEQWTSPWVYHGDAEDPKGEISLTVTYRDIFGNKFKTVSQGGRIGTERISS